ncbi:FAD-dependent monooxygenase [Burkholderia multivorans]|uniref:FAD-dependent monooxygenase n=1 Tax=Burkholderia multivorans TaxID=87883 RepID=UPI000CFE7AED|nr:FAD-dependent monooxygenase [Burkholderia multivorans]MBJ9657485.1 FAD-dependent monooxygenase [Burkholderia multivorans]MBR8044166.1 FAD-dependent monooxygenase [Burkholderia multivorans]MDN8008981.1 FAD-dependent monooxygenase [Burkholderia multivorans]MDR8872722.1 Anhydrotetracycline monooxygenase [Burkholderia multivorans]MDR8879138.1 Anhydrotetracycline monooxygenase [Burkholderia multivorans]
MTDLQNNVDTDVIIVGGGPVGMGLAIDLAQRGVRCIVVERYLTPQPIPKGQNLTQRTMEHFRSWGAEKALRAARTIPPEYGIGGLTAYGTLLGPYSYDWLQRELVKPYYYTANERLPQYATEEVLRARLAQLPNAQTLYGWNAETITQDASGVTVEVAERRGEGRKTLRASYVVGCDGSRSSVRQQSGITQTLEEHDRLMVLLVFRSPELHALLERFPGKSYYNILQPELEGYWKFLGRVDLGNTWFFHAPVPLGTTAENFDFRSYLHGAIGAEFQVEFEHIGFWDLRFAIADRYRAGRIFIAGDAAHSHPPYGGYGVNSGLEDARNLGWKLAAVIHGHAGDALLESYDAERRPVFVSTANDFIAKSIDVDRQFLKSFNPAVDLDAFRSAWESRASGAVGEVHSFEPHYEGSPVVRGVSGGVCSAVGSHRFEARAGHHLPPAPLIGGGDAFEKLGPGFTLLCIGPTIADARAFSDAAAALSVPLKLVSLAPDSGAERYAARWILVRPDEFVAWTSQAEACSTQDAMAILAQATGKM